MIVRNISLTAGALIAVGVAVGLSTSSRDSQNPQDPRSFDGPRVERASRVRGSLLLTVRVDAHGVAVVETTRKPELSYVRKSIWDRQPYGWVMKDAKGQPIAEGGFHPGNVDVDPALFGQNDRVRGDVLIPTCAHLNVKVPDLESFATIEFSRRENGQSLPFGLAQAAAQTIR